jgi:hypothetical protein
MVMSVVVVPVVVKIWDRHAAASAGSNQCW